MYHLIIFVKNPVLGKVKTRLAASIGNERALEVYLKLLEITRKAALETDCVRNVFYSDEIAADAWDDDKFNKFVQEGDSLGDRMKNAFEQVFALGATKAAIIGSDCPALTSDIIKGAFAALNDKDVCIGPAQDGGYYLIGMNELYPFLFHGKTWSTDSVLQETINDIEEKDLSYSLLSELSDLDNLNDLKHSNLNFPE